MLPYHHLSIIVFVIGMFQRRREVLLVLLLFWFPSLFSMPNCCHDFNASLQVGVLAVVVVEEEEVQIVVAAVDVVVVVVVEEDNDGWH